MFDTGSSFSFLTFFDLSSKVLGSIFGNNLIATGSRNSMNGMTMNTRNGTSRNKSEAVRRNCRYMMNIIIIKALLSKHFLLLIIILKYIYIGMKGSKELAKNLVQISDSKIEIGGFKIRNKFRFCQKGSVDFEFKTLFQQIQSPLRCNRSAYSRRPSTGYEIYKI